MRIYTGKNITTATTANNSYKKLLNALARCASSTSFQSTVTIQPGKPYSSFRSARGEASDHLTSTRDNNTRLEEDMDELEWHRIISTPHVRGGIHRLAAEARRQIAAGEIEEGGFGVE